MQLYDYLKREKIKCSKFAQMLDMHPQTIRSYVNHLRYPSYMSAKAIEEVTGGEVTMEDFIVDKPQPKLCPTCNRKMWPIPHRDKNKNKKNKTPEEFAIEKKLEFECGDFFDDNPNHTFITLDIFCKKHPSFPLSPNLLQRLMIRKQLTDQRILRGWKIVNDEVFICDEIFWADLCAAFKNARTDIERLNKGCDPQQGEDSLSAKAESFS